MRPATKALTNTYTQMCRAKTATFRDGKLRGSKLVFSGKLALTKEFAYIKGVPIPRRIRMGYNARLMMETCAVSL